MDSDLQLRRCAALDGWADELAKSGSEAVRLSVAPFRAVLALRGSPADQSLGGDLERVLGVELPLVPNRWHGDARTVVVWLGPDEWLVIASDREAAEIATAVLDARPNDPWLSLAEVSASYTAIRVSGPRARELIAMGCPLDLRADRFAAGDCAQTLLARSRVLLRCLDEEHAFELWVHNSFARYTAGWLADACIGQRHGGHA